jgi:hypothetical protein
MSTLAVLLIIVLVLCLAGGGWGWRSDTLGANIPGVLYLILMVALIVFLLRALGVL